MSIENHPNINAAGLCSDVIDSIIKYSRGKASGGKALTSKRVIHAVTNFCTQISIILDEDFGTDKKAVDEL